MNRPCSAIALLLSFKALLLNHNGQRCACSQESDFRVRRPTRRTPFPATSSALFDPGLQQTFVLAAGNNLSEIKADLLPQPLPFTGLGRNSSTSSFSHCGKWLNAVWRDDENASVVHGYFHQEWQCDYSRGFTNKSVGYAVSTDGGRTFTPWGQQQLIAGANFSTAHQTGEGDHGVIRVGDWLYMFFLAWNGAPHLGIGVARAPVVSKGRPGAWRKWFNGGFSEPGVGGNCTRLNGMPGTSVGLIESLGLTLAVGVTWCAMGISAARVNNLTAGWSPLQGGALFDLEHGTWDRTPSSGELFAYPSLYGDLGNGAVDLNTTAPWLTFTYLAPGTTFADRFHVRRRFRLLLASNDEEGSATTTASLQALSLWTAASGQAADQMWVTAGPVLHAPSGAFAAVNATVYSGTVAYVLTTAQGATTQRLYDCWVPSVGAFALTTESECGGNFTAGILVRPAGYVAVSAAAAKNVFAGWTDGGVTEPLTGQRVVFDATALWRCRCVDDASGSTFFIAATVAVETAPATCELPATRSQASCIPDAPLGVVLTPPPV